MSEVERKNSLNVWNCKSARQYQTHSQNACQIELVNSTLQRDEFFRDPIKDNRFIKRANFDLTRIVSLILFHSLEWTVNDSRVLRRGAFLVALPVIAASLERFIRC